MVESINAWIQNGCNYALGVSLYEQYGDSNFFKGIFKRAQTEANLQKLIELLTALVEAEPTAAPNSILPVAPMAMAPANKHAVEIPQTTNNVPLLLRVLVDRKKTYADIQSLHPQLSIVPEGEDLRALADHIIRTGKRNTELWIQYNYLTEHPDEAGDDMPAPPPPVMIDLNLIDKRESIRKSLNKAENRIKGEANPKQKTLDLIAQRKAELKDLDDHIAKLKQEATK
jgi:hypothetical protein